MAKKQIIGVFGGTFDPPHQAHLEVGRQVALELGMAQILFVVANDPWQKTLEKEITSATDRFKMVQLMLAQDPNLVASDVELVLGGESVTAQTLERLTPLYPNCDLDLIVGYDAALGIETWRDYERIFEYARIVVVDRPGKQDELPGFLNGALRVTGPSLDISSDDIKDRLQRGFGVEGLLPESVKTYIVENLICDG